MFFERKIITVACKEASYNDSCAALHYFPINRETFDISSSYWVALRCICLENISINVIIKSIDFKIIFCIEGCLHWD